LEIGDGSVISCGAHVYTHSTVRRTRDPSAPLEHAPVKIGRRVTVGANAVVLMGCEIGDGAVVGAGAVVKEHTKIGSGETWIGVPARRAYDDLRGISDAELSRMARGDFDPEVSSE
jgi:acetyltransferase-like isoleucine patch superfamily enzyme